MVLAGYDQGIYLAIKSFKSEEFIKHEQDALRSKLARLMQSQFATNEVVRKAVLGDTELSKLIDANGDLELEQHETIRHSIQAQKEG